MDGPTIFVSYASEHRRAVAGMVRRLVRLGRGRVSVRWDEGEVRAGDDILAVLRDRIQSSHLLLLFLSADSARKPWVREELDIARANDVRIYALSAGEVDLPAELADLHVQRLSWWSDRDALLVEAVRLALQAAGRPPPSLAPRILSRLLAVAPLLGALMAVGIGLVARGQSQPSARVFVVEVRHDADDSDTAPMGPLANALRCVLEAKASVVAIAARLDVSRPDAMSIVEAAQGPRQTRLVVPTESDSTLVEGLAAEAGSAQLILGPGLFGEPFLGASLRDGPALSLRMAGVAQPRWADVALLPLDARARIRDSVPQVPADVVCGAGISLEDSVVVLAERFRGDTGALLGGGAVSRPAVHAVLAAVASAGAPIWRLDQRWAALAACGVLVASWVGRVEGLALAGAAAPIVAVLLARWETVLPVSPLLILGIGGWILWRLRW